MAGACAAIPGPRGPLRARTGVTFTAPPRPTTVRSILRVLLAVVIIVLVACGAAAVALRQPTLTRIAYRSTARSDAALLRRHVAFLTTAAIPRDAQHPEMLDAAAAYIAAVFRSSGAEVEEQRYAARGATYRNVIARYGPADDRRPVVIIGAHYDAFSANVSLPGADDNASGTAGLLELARLMQQSPPAGPVLLVAYSTEEPPFFGSDQMGSAVHAQSLSQASRPVKAMISLEMIGCFSGVQTWESPLLSFFYGDSPDFIGVTGGWDDRALVRTIKKAMRGAGGVDVVSFNGPREMLDASDQRNYWARGWSAAMITDTAFLRNPRYHTIHDTADTLDYVKMARVVDGVLNATLALSGQR